MGRGYNGEHNEVNQRGVSSDYFATLQATILRGRTFTDAEDMSKPQVVVINQTLAKKYFPGEDPIGQRFGDTDLNPKSIKEIIGIVDDIREGPLDSEIWPAYYYPFNQHPDIGYSVVVRTSQADQSLIPTVSDAIRGIDSRINISSQTTMTQRVNNAPTVYLRRSATWLVGGFAALALLLGVVGLYGVIAYSVSQRTREIGVRIALGAQRGSVYRLILKEAAALTLAGIVIGIGCAIIAASLMRKLLFGTIELDRACEVARRGSGPVETTHAMVARGLVARAAGDLETARTYIGDARSTLLSCPDPGPVVSSLVKDAERRLPSRASRTRTFAPLVEEFSERELEVLHLLGGQLSQREIGELLFISFNTVKTHSKSIYRKLDVGTRAEAVGRAREFHLI